MGFANSNRDGRGGRDQSGGGRARPQGAGKRPSSPAGGTHKANGGASVHVVTFHIPSEFPRSREVQKQILDAIAHNGFNANSAFAVKLALEEALINAIKHGNREDPGKNVHVEARVTADQVEIIIEDEGPGFDRAAVPDPTLEENLEKCSGRGILLIESYMTEAHWSNGGRRLRMIKKNEPDVVPRR